jgi:hypothetical protein
MPNKKPAQSKIITRLKKEGFELINGEYVRGNHRVVITPDHSTSPVIEDVRFYLPNSATPVFHTNAGVTPKAEFWKNFLNPTTVKNED